MKKLADAFRLLDYSINTEYRKYKERIPKKHKVSKRSDLLTLIKCICKHTANQVSESRGGVHLDGIGYFFVMKIPRKLKYNFKVKGKPGVEERYNYHTNHHMFSPIFLPSLDSRKTLGSWSMDNSFCEVVKNKINDKITKEGVSYKIYPYSIRALNRK